MQDRSIKIKSLEILCSRDRGQAPTSKASLPEARARARARARAQAAGPPGPPPLLRTLRSRDLPARGPSGHPRLPASQLARVPQEGEPATTHGARPHEHRSVPPEARRPSAGPLPQKILPPPPHPQDHLLPAPQATLDPAPAPPAPAPWIPRAWCVGRLPGPQPFPLPEPWRARPSRTCPRSLPVGRADRPAGPLRDRNRHRCPPPAGGGGRHRLPRSSRPRPPAPAPPARSRSSRSSRPSLRPCATACA